MFTVSKQIEIDAGHRVPYHDSQCRYLHGHRWKVVAYVGAPELIPPDVNRADSGMVVDFSIIKQALKVVVHTPFDHRLILWEEDPLVSAAHFMDALEEIADLHLGVVTVPMIPTSEGLARYWAEGVASYLNVRGVKLVKLDVWETPNSVASYYMPERTRKESRNA